MERSDKKTVLTQLLFEKIDSDEVNAIVEEIGIEYEDISDETPVKELYYSEIGPPANCKAKIWNRIHADEAQKPFFSKLYDIFWPHNAVWKFIFATAALFLIIPLYFWYSLSENANTANYAMDVFFPKQGISGTSTSLAVDIQSVMEPAIAQAADAKAQPPAEITVKLKRSRHFGEKTLYQGRLGADGFLSAPFTLPEVEPGKYHLAVLAKVGDHTTHYNHRIEITNKPRLSLSTSKPIYQPGDEVKWRLLLVNSSNTTPVENAVIDIALTDGKQELIRVSETSNDFGIASGSMKVPDDLTDGVYYLNAGYLKHKEQVPLIIAQIEKPDYLLEWQNLPNTAILGETLKAQLKITRPKGAQPARDEVLIETLLCQDDCVGLSTTRPEKLDDSTYAIEITLDKALKSQIKENRNAWLAIRGKVGQDELKGQTTKRIRITEAPVEIDIIPEKEPLLAGVPCKFYFFSKDRFGQPIATEFVFKLNHSDTSQLVKTNEKGFGVLELTPSSDPEQLAHIAVKNTDGSIYHKRFVWPMEQTGLTVKTDKDSYRVGENLEARIWSCNLPNEEVIVHLSHDGIVKQSQLTRLVDGAGKVSFVLRPDDTGLLDVHVMTHDYTTHSTANVRIQDRTDLVLALERKMNDDLTSNIDVQLSDLEGHPMTGSLGVIGSDLRLHNLAAEIGLQELMPLSRHLPMIAKAEHEPSLFEQISPQRLFRHSAHAQEAAWQRFSRNFVTISKEPEVLSAERQADLSLHKSHLLLYMAIGVLLVTLYFSMRFLQSLAAHALRRQTRVFLSCLCLVTGLFAALYLSDRSYALQKESYTLKDVAALQVQTTKVAQPKNWQQLGNDAFIDYTKPLSKMVEESAKQPTEAVFGHEEVKKLDKGKLAVLYEQEFELFLPDVRLDESGKAQFKLPVIENAPLCHLEFIANTKDGSLVTREATLSEL